MRRLRKIIKTRGHFPSDEAASKLIWLALRTTASGVAVRSPITGEPVPSIQPHEYGLTETLLRRLGADLVAEYPATPPILFINRSVFTPVAPGVASKCNTCVA